LWIFQNFDFLAYLFGGTKASPARKGNTKATSFNFSTSLKEKEGKKI
jgi:hypothetical protein